MQWGRFWSRPFGQPGANRLCKVELEKAIADLQSVGEFIKRTWLRVVDLCAQCEKQNHFSFLASVTIKFVIKN